ncbi:MAG TPA: c-type cytochrome biogenesis protein CcmI [Acetobacteraceae bacterium]|nr:c-type cytochrome biogenesis protein CcmI [Acetobacteraceae bacterium]
MIFLLLFTAVALCAVTVVCLPLVRGVPMVAERGQFDRAVYRDQLQEVERDVARGVLNPAEAGSARLEIQRRLLAVDAVPRRQVWSEPSPRLAAFVAILVLGGATGLYLHFGSPSLPDAPFNGRLAQHEADAAHGQHMDMHQAAQALEQKLQASPNDGAGWVLLGRTEAMLGDWQKATDAYRQAVGLGRTSPDVMAGYGEMQVLAAGGIVPPAAHAAFTAVLAADPKNEVARYYLAVADAQAGEDKRAIDRWLALAADLPEDSAMREAIGRGVAEAAKDGGIPVPALPKGAAPAPQPQASAAARPGPSQDQMAAAGNMSDAQRKQMIEGMVAQLAAHLQQAPNDLDGWLRLGRSYAVLGDTDKAVAAFARAAALKPDDPGIKMQEFQAMIAGLQPDSPLPPSAVALLHQVATAAPDEPDVLWYLGMEAASNGKPDDARREWTKLLSQLPPDGEDAKLVRTALDALKRK